MSHATDAELWRRTASRLLNEGDSDTETALCVGLAAVDALLDIAQSLRVIANRT